MPAKPIDTLSMMPSSTEVITTRAKTPRVSRLSVSSERSLCAHSSTSPPVTTSTPRLSWTSGPRRSLIPQRLHRREPARLPGRVESEEEAEGAGQRRRPAEARHRDRQRHADRGGDHLREDDADRQPETGAEDRHQQRLGHEALEDLATRGADGHLHAHLAHPVLERRSEEHTSELQSHV